MDNKAKIKKLEEKGFTWFLIADIIDLTYSEVRNISEGFEG